MPRALIAASGTGGHIFPALSVAEALPASWEIFWIGVPGRLENQVVPKKYPLILIPVAGLQGAGIRKLLQLIRLVFSIVDVIRLIKSKRIQIVFTTGGYIAAPVIIASKLCGIKSILHESNAFPGKVTRLLGRFCEEVALGLPSADEYLQNCRTIFTGTPVRDLFLLSNCLPEWVPQGLGPLIVVVGGSQGAVGLNQMVEKIFPRLLKLGCRLVFIKGKNFQSSIRNENLVEKSFTHEMPALLQHADLVISRSGAGTLSELAICGTPAIFVPYPYAADKHQDFNAAYAAQFGAAFIVHQNKTGHRTLVKALELFLSKRLLDKDKNLLLKMSEGMKKIAVKDAQIRLVNLITKHIR